MCRYKRRRGLHRYESQTGSSVQDSADVRLSRKGGIPSRAAHVAGVISNTNLNEEARATTGRIAVGCDESDLREDLAGGRVQVNGFAVLFQELM